MDFQTIKCEHEEGVLRITLDRPEALNAFNGVLLKEVREALNDAEGDPKVRVILVDSACEKAFSAGIDVTWVKDLNGAEIREVGRELHRTFLKLRTIEKPVVAAVDGLCLGAGLEFGVSCDFMIASDRSRFGLPNIERGIPAIVEAALLPIAVGIQATRELTLLGEYWDAHKAERKGLVQGVFNPEDHPREVASVCDRLARMSRHALGTQKEIIHKWLTADLEAAIDFSINTVVLNWQTRDQQEGMGAFVEKRTARFDDDQN